MMSCRNNLAPRNLWVSCLLMLWVWIFSSYVYAQTNVVAKKYPPYPNVWDWMSSAKESARVLGVELRSDGDILITYDGKGTTFFSRQISPPTVSQKWVHGEATIHLKNGFIIQRTGALGGRSGGCYNRLDAVITQKDGSGKDRARKKLLYVYENPRRYVTKKECLDGPSFINRVDSVFADFIELEDRTLLFIDHEHGLIIRFDENFNTRSSLIGDRLFLIDEGEFFELLRGENYGSRENGNLNLQIQQDSLHKELLGMKGRNAK